MDLIVSLEGEWRVFRVDGTRLKRIEMEEAGPKVWRIAPGDRSYRLPKLSAARANKEVMRDLGSRVISVRRGEWVYGCPESDRETHGRIIYPVTANVQASLPAPAGEARRAPVIAAIRLDEMIAAMWPVAADGAVGACRVVAADSDADLEMAAPDVAAKNRIEGYRLVVLAGPDQAGAWLAQWESDLKRAISYPRPGEWHGVQAWRIAAAGAAMSWVAAGISLAAMLHGEYALHEAHTEVKNARMALARSLGSIGAFDRDHVAVLSARRSFPLAGSIDAARVVWYPGTTVAMHGRTLSVTLGGAIDRAQGAPLPSPAALSAMLATTPPAPWHFKDIRILPQGSGYEVIYGR